MLTRDHNRSISQLKHSILGWWLPGRLTYNCEKGFALYTFAGQINASAAMTDIQVIALDADDTLWHNEPFYTCAKERFIALIAPYQPAGAVEEVLNERELANLRYFGYGIKSFTLSLIESAIALTGGQVRAQDIQAILDTAKEVLTAELQLFPQVEETLAALASRYPLMLITKGDQNEQESKVARSGLGKYFRYIEVVGDKDESSYGLILGKYGIEPRRFLMVGNSLRSDILPVLRLGGRAVYIPYANTWAHENAVDEQPEAEDYMELPSLSALPELLRSWSDQG